MDPLPASLQCEAGYFARYPRRALHAARGTVFRYSRLPWRRT